MCIAVSVSLTLVGKGLISSSSTWLWVDRKRSVHRCRGVAVGAAGSWWDCVPWGAAAAAQPEISFHTEMGAQRWRDCLLFSREARNLDFYEKPSNFKRVGNSCKLKNHNFKGQAEPI